MKKIKLVKILTISVFLMFFSNSLMANVTGIEQDPDLIKFIDTPSCGKIDELTEEIREIEKNNDTYSHLYNGNIGNDIALTKLILREYDKLPADYIDYYSSFLFPYLLPPIFIDIVPPNIVVVLICKL